MNLTEVRQDLLEQLQARVADGIAEGMALRYCLAIGGERRVVDVAELATPVPWSWNLCIAAGGAGAEPEDGAPPQEPDNGPRAWEVLEFVGSPEDAFRVVEILRDLLREEWKVGEGRLECAVQGETGWNGHEDELGRSLVRITGGGDLRFRGAERAPVGRIRLHVVEEVGAALDPASEARRLRIQIDPHELFAFVLGFERECDLEPLSQVFDVAEDLGIEVAPEERAAWSARLRFWAHGMNLIELASPELAEAPESDEQGIAVALRAVLDSIEDAGGRHLEALAPSEARVALARWLDAARAIEDELCAVLLAMPETTGETEVLRAEVGGESDDEERADASRSRRKKAASPSHGPRNGDHATSDAGGGDLAGRNLGDQHLEGQRLEDQHLEDRCAELDPSAEADAAEAPGEPATAGESSFAGDPAVAEELQGAGGRPVGASSAEGGAPARDRVEGFPVDAPPEEVFTSEASPTASDLHLVPVSPAAARQLEPTAFAGDEQDACEAKVLELFDAEGTPVARLDAGDQGWVAVNRTCFYAWGAGVQVDRGLGVWGEGRGRILDARCIQDVVFHALQLDHGFLRPGASIDLLLDRRRRREVERQTTAAAAVTSLLDRWCREGAGGAIGARRNGRGSGARAEVLEFKASIEGFSLGLRLPEGATRGWGAAERWRDRLEQEIGEWTLEAWWIDPAGSADEAREALELAVADAGVGRESRRIARRALSLGPLGFVRSDAVVVPNSAHVGLVLLATPERLYDDVWTVRGVAGKRALALARTEVHLVEDAAGELALAPRRATARTPGGEGLTRGESAAAADEPDLEELETVR
jgi:hypothetical protein